MRKTAVLYPYCEEILYAVTLFEQLQEEYEVRYLVSPPGFGYTGKDAGYACNHPPIGQVVYGKFPTEKEWDVLLLFEPVLRKGDFFLKECMEKALLQRKEVIFLSAWEGNIPEEIQGIIQKYPEQTKVKTCPVVLVQGGDMKIHEPEVPVLLVGGLLREADCFAVFIKLVERFRREGSRIAGFSDHPLSGLFDLFSLDHIWGDREASEEEKVKKLNLYINFVARRRNAEIILLEAPDVLMKYNEAAPNGFGIRSHMLCQAVAPDYLVGCIPFDVAEGKLLDMLGEGLSYRLGCNFCAVHVSNVLLDTPDALRKQTVEIVHVDMEFVQKQLNKQDGESKIPMFDVIRDGIEGMYERIRNYGG